MAELVTSVEDVQENLLTIDRYAAGTSVERSFHAKRIKNGKLFVASQIDNRFLFAPSKFSGYRKNDLRHEDDLEDRDGRDTNRRISDLIGPPIEETSHDYQRIDDAFLQYCSGYRIVPSKHHRRRRYWLVEQYVAADELPAGVAGLNEGALQQVYVNRYERNASARRACIVHHGYDCVVCGFNFARAYGELGQGYIHVHHLIPLASIRTEYQVDPINDLRPVCPNCHAMLHRTKEACSVDELREKLVTS